MAYQPNIPQATDRLSKSQGDLLGNFQAIKTFVDVNHEDFASPQSGKHKLVAFTDQTGSIPATDAPRILVYNAKDAANVQQLYINNGVATAFPFTQNNSANGGWTYLPSGIILAWAIVNVGTTAPNFVATHFNNIPLTTATFGANFPGFTNAFNAQLTYNAVAVNSGYVAFAVALSSGTLQVSNNVVGSQPLNIFVIGN